MNQKRIMIVENELVIAEDLKDILAEKFWETVAICTSVEEALAQIDQAKPDLVLIDIQLNGKRKGTEIGKALLQKDTIPYVYITSFTDENTLEKAKMTRPQGYIVKPFRPKDVLATLEIIMYNHDYKKIDPNRLPAPVSNDIPFRLRKVVAYILDHLDEKLPLEMLADIARWKPNHFIKNFKSYLGVTPHRYILQQRICRAKYLLAHTPKPISDIAYAIGFQSHSHFSAAFCKMTALTPEQFRRNQVGALEG